MAYSINALDNLSDCFRALPGIGEKTAQRLAFFVLDMPEEKAEKFAKAILDAKRDLHFCPVCQNFTDREICTVCSDPKRDESVICVVESPSDVMAIERTSEFRGRYHVLHGAMSPMDNIGPGDIKIKELLHRLADETVKEIIIATNPTVEGDVTAAYIAKLIKPLGVNVSRLAFGLPVGGDLEYADKLTLSKAIENRSKI
jgi:recombination protein RecR